MDRFPVFEKQLFSFLFDYFLLELAIANYAARF